MNCFWRLEPIGRWDVELIICHRGHAEGPYGTCGALRCPMLRGQVRSCRRAIELAPFVAHVDVHSRVAASGVSVCVHVRVPVCASPSGQFVLQDVARWCTNTATCYRYTRW